MFRYLFLIMFVSKSVALSKTDYSQMSAAQLIKEIAERDTKIAERDTKIAERDTKIAEKDVMLQNQRAEIARMAYLENAQNPDVCAYIPEERLRKKAAEEKGTLYTYTNEDFKRREPIDFRILEVYWLYFPEKNFAPFRIDDFGGFHPALILSPPDSKSRCWVAPCSSTAEYTTHPINITINDYLVDGTIKKRLTGYILTDQTRTLPCDKYISRVFGLIGVADVKYAIEVHNFHCDDNGFADRGLCNTLKDYIIRASDPYAYWE